MADVEDHQWMRHALSLAQKAEAAGEVPVGAVLVLENKIIAEGMNQPIGLCDPTAHAEIQALRRGADTLKNYRLVNTTLYVTLEPCAMCLGALIHARVARLVFGAYDFRAGAVQTVFSLGDSPHFNHRLRYEGGVLEKECAEMLSAFFKAKR